MPPLGVGLAAPAFGAIAPGAFGMLGGGAVAGGGLQGFLGPLTKGLGGLFGGGAEGVGESFLQSPGFRQDRFFNPRPFEGPEQQRFELTQGAGQFGLDAAQDFLGSLGQIPFEGQGPGGSINLAELGEIQRGRQLADLERFQKQVDAASVAGAETAGLQRGAAGQIGFLDKDLLTQLGVDILDRGEGGLIPGIVEQAFGPFAEKGRQALEEELAGMGLLTAGGASSTRGAEARGSFEAELAAAKAGQSGTLLGQFLQPFGVQSTSAGRQSDIFRQALGSENVALPFQQALLNRRLETAGTDFAPGLARDIAKLNILPQFLQVASQPQITLPTGSETTERENILPSTLDLALGTGLKGLGTTIGLMTGKSIFGDGKPGDNMANRIKKLLPFTA